MRGDDRRRILGGKRAKLVAGGKGRAVIGLHEDLPMSAVQRNRHLITSDIAGPGFGRWGRSGNHRQRAVARERHLPADRKPVRRGEADAQSRKATGAAIDRDRRRAPRAEQALDHRQQMFGMAAADQRMPLVDEPISVDQGYGAGGSGAVDHEQHRKLDPTSFVSAPAGASECGSNIVAGQSARLRTQQWLHTASTASTSGT
jgi:hypothetical protein